MIIGTNRKLHQSNSGSLYRHISKCQEKQLAEKSARYLGVILDNQMKWKDHIGLIFSKVSRASGMIKHAKKYYQLIY